MTVRDGLVAEYTFAGSARDSSGAERHGQVHGATLVADRFGRADHAYQFDGVDDYIEVAPPPAFPASALSVSAWARYEPGDLPWWTNCIVAQDDGNDEDQSRRVFQLSTFEGHVVGHRMIGARDPISRRRVRADRWYHMVAIHDHGTNQLYIDRVLQDTVQHRLWTHPTQPLHIGRKGSGEGFFFFRGAIDDVRLYNRALSPADVQTLFREDGWSPPPDGPVRDADLSGLWGQGGVVYLNLQSFDDGRVTGEVMAGRPGNTSAIQTGTFDPATATLRLAGTAIDPRNRQPVDWTIEATVDRDEITARARFDDFDGNVILTKAGAGLRWSRRSIRSHLDVLAFRLRRLGAPR